MRTSFWVPLVLGLSVVVLAQEDSHCILYPAARRADDQRRVSRELEFQRFSKPAKRSRAAAPSPAASANFIDDYIFARIAADGVPLADPPTDPDFVRRIYLDLTGHIPTAEQVVAFKDDPNSGKRRVLIEHAGQVGDVHVVHAQRALRALVLALVVDEGEELLPERRPVRGTIGRIRCSTLDVLDEELCRRSVRVASRTTLTLELEPERASFSATIELCHGPTVFRSRQRLKASGETRTIPRRTSRGISFMISYAADRLTPSSRAISEAFR